MNYIRHLNGFYDRVQEDNRLNPTHISLYLALFQFWNLNHFRNPISISRNEMMRLSKISAFGTYHKCIKDLQEFGYLEYMPSFNPYKGSMVNLLSFDEVPTQKYKEQRIKKQSTDTQAVNRQHIKKHTADAQALIPSKNNTNSTNNKHRGIPTQKIFSENEDLQGHPEPVEGTLTGPVYPEQSRSVEPDKKFHPPALPEIRLYFEEKEAPWEEAEKFFNHYESNGWLVGGKSKMKNWQAAARNWLLNAKKFNPVTLSSSKGPKSNHLNATTQKTYTDPL